MPPRDRNRVRLAKLLRAGGNARVNMRLPQPLIDAVKARAAERGIPYQRLIREALERAVRR